MQPENTRPWLALLTRRRDFLIALAGAVVVVAIYYPFSPGAIQRRNMAKAEAYIPTIQAALGNLPRFSRVVLRTATAHDGCLLVAGQVPTNADRDELRKIVMTTAPPVEVVFHVDTDEEFEIKSP